MPRRLTVSTNFGLACQCFLLNSQVTTKLIACFDDLRIKPSTFMGFFVKVDRSGNKGRYYRKGTHVPNIFRGIIMCGIARIREQELATFFSMKMMLEALINGQDGNGTLVGGAFAKFSFFNAFFYNRKQGVIERFIAIVERPKACRFFRAALSTSMKSRGSSHFCTTSIMMRA